MQQETYPASKEGAGWWPTESVRFSVVASGQAFSCILLFCSEYTHIGLVKCKFYNRNWNERISDVNCDWHFDGERFVVVTRDCPLWGRGQLLLHKCSLPVNPTLEFWMDAPTWGKNQGRMASVSSFPARTYLLQFSLFLIFCVSADSRQKPNIVLILTDDQVEYQIINDSLEVILILSRTLSWVGQRPCHKHHRFCEIRAPSFQSR